MRAAVADLDGTVLDSVAAGGFFVRFPAGEVLAVEHGGPAVVVSGQGDEGEGREGGQGEVFEHRGAVLTQRASGFHLFV